MATRELVSLNTFKEVIKPYTLVNKTLKVFEALERHYEDSHLGMQLVMLAEKLFELNDFTKVLQYGNRAVASFLASNTSNSHQTRLLLLDIMSLMALSCFNMRDYQAMFNYMKWAKKFLRELLRNDDDKNLLDIHTRMYAVNVALCNRDEAVIHALKVLEIKERVLTEGCAQLGEAYKTVSEAYLRAFDHKAALPFCLKAMRIYENIHGKKSLEFARLERKLALICEVRREYQLSLDFNQSVHRATMIELGGYDEAVEAMNPVVDAIGDRTEGWLKVKSFLTMARALCYLGEDADAEKHIREAQRMLEEKVIEDPVLVSAGFSELSLLYQMKDDLDTTISMMKKALEFPRLPEKLLLQLSAAFMSLLSESGKLNEEVSYLHGEVEKLKASFGDKHCVVGYAHAHLGVAYFGSDQKDQGVKSFENAKDILDDTRGSNHLDSLRISHSLSLALAKQGRYDKAIEVEERVIEGLVERKQQSEAKLLERATKHLNSMKESMRESRTRALSS